ncbi:ATP-binding protein [Microbacterium phosphatis]|uniref:ATP-binding protein n=1 Tax=Microbacterium phosphatis TaxID=3140248 RepID=UPI00314042F7
MAGESRYEVGGLAVPAEIARLHELLDRAGTEHPDIAATDLMLFETAVIEIATNVVEHGRPEGEVSWHFTLQVDDEALRAELRDSGQEADVDFGRQMPGADAESGRGLALAGAILDEIVVTRVEGGNLWRMVRRRG